MPLCAMPPSNTGKMKIRFTAKVKDFLGESPAGSLLVTVSVVEASRNSHSEQMSP